MSGIAGIVRFDGQPVAPGKIQEMTDVMPYRGPDGINHWTGDTAALGHCMLCTTPESLEEQQPLVSDDGRLVMVMDGRVDNWVELRRELNLYGVQLRNKSDAELVLAAYQQWGNECLAHMQGDFALAIWNPQSQALFCARDPMGNKPFYYYWDGKMLAFASELHAILTLPEVPQVINKGVVAEFLAADLCSRSDTFWEGIQRLVAAHKMTLNSRGLALEQYWSPDLWATLPYVKDEDFIEHYRQTLFETVRKQSRCHRPLASEVSGGLDSSAIFAVAESLRKDGKLLSPDVIGYTMDFSFDADANELDYCRAVGESLGKPINEVPPSMPPLSWNKNQAKHYRDFPGYPNGAMALGLNQSARDAGSRVLFNGVGGDEWLGASPVYYAEELAALRLGNITKCLKQDMLAVGPFTSLWWLIRSGVLQFLPQIVKSRVRKFNSDPVERYDRAAWLISDLRLALKDQKERSCPDSLGPVRWPGQHSELELLASAFSIHGHETHEKMAARCQLELRRPFCTAPMVQLSFMMPKRLLYRCGINRYAHRQALKGLLPDKVLTRDNKAEFSVTYRRIMEGMEKLLLQEIPDRRAEWVSAGRTAAMYRNQSQKHYDGWEDSMLWQLFGVDALCSND